MFNPIRAYRRSQEIQRTWIRTHPVQFVAINVVMTAMVFGYIEYKDRREMRKFEEEHPPSKIN